MFERQLLERHFRVFADPATEFRLEGTDDDLVISLVRDAERRTYAIRSDGVVHARHSGRRFSGIASLLASEEFADIRELRATQRRLLADLTTRPQLDPAGSLVAPGIESSLDMESYRNALMLRPGSDLHLVLIDGPAGIGKTSLIERMVNERASSDSDQPPLLHVVSSGKRLTSLTQELAQTTQRLRAKFTFDQVPILAFWGVIQVAIDGFDELADDAGYKDAWSALREFLGQVGYGGPVVLAGRDTFFDQQAFAERLLERIPNLKLTSVRLQTVSRSAARRYLRECGWSEADLAGADQRDWFRDGTYQLRPFFLAQIGSKGGWESLQGAYGSPQSFLVASFVRREAELVSGSVAIDPKVAEEALWAFYGMIVEDMALHETDAVDTGYIALACEAAFGDVLSAEDLRKLLHKAGSIGFLEEAGTYGLRRFPHSEIQAQFLARSLCKSLVDAKLTSTFLRRTVVSLSLAEAFSDVVVRYAAEDVGRIIATLLSLREAEAFSDRVSSNTTSLVFSCLSHASLSQAPVLQGGVCSAVRAVGVLGRVICLDVVFLHFDARGADLSEVSFEGCSFTMLAADASTRFGASWPKTGAIVVSEPSGGSRTLRSPNDVGAWYVDHSVRADATVDISGLELVKFFERVCRKFIRQHQIRNGESDESYFLVASPLWSEIRDVLGDRLEFVAAGKSASGPNDGFFRLKSPEELLVTPRSSEAEAIWAKLIDRAQALRLSKGQ